MLSISKSFSNNCAASNRSVNFKSNIIKSTALNKAIRDAKVDIFSDKSPDQEIGQQFYRALHGLKNDGKKDNIMFDKNYYFGKGDTPSVWVNGEKVKHYDRFDNVSSDDGAQLKMAVIDFAKKRGIDLNKPALAIEEKLDLLKKQVKDTEAKMYLALNTKLNDFWDS